jgi:hypothetical protein
MTHAVAEKIFSAPLHQASQNKQSIAHETAAPDMAQCVNSHTDASFRALRNIHRKRQTDGTMICTQQSIQLRKFSATNGLLDNDQRRTLAMPSSSSPENYCSPTVRQRSMEQK